MDISIKKDDGSITVYYELPDAVEYAISHALLFTTPALIFPAEAVEQAENTPALIFPAEVVEQAEKAADTFLREAFAPETGACMCTSFSQALEPDDDGQIYCVICEHPAHNTRAHCGALR